MTMTLQTMNLDYSNNDDDEDEEDDCDIVRRKGGLIDDWPFFAFFTSNYCFCGRVKKAGCNLTKSLLHFNSGLHAFWTSTKDPLFPRTFCQYLKQFHTRVIPWHPGAVVTSNSIDVLRRWVRHGH